MNREEAVLLQAFAVHEHCENLFFDEIWAFAKPVPAKYVQKETEKETELFSACFKGLRAIGGNYVLLDSAARRAFCVLTHPFSEIPTALYRLCFDEPRSVEMISELPANVERVLAVGGDAALLVEREDEVRVVVSRLSLSQLKCNVLGRFQLNQDCKITAAAEFESCLYLVLTHGDISTLCESHDAQTLIATASFPSAAVNAFHPTEQIFAWVDEPNSRLMLVNLLSHSRHPIPIAGEYSDVSCLVFDLFDVIHCNVNRHLSPVYTCT